MQPALFVSHGAPTLALDDSPTGRFLVSFFAARPVPGWILVASAHDATREPRVGAAAAPSTVHDFGGFPEALYRIGYPAPGDPRRADAVVAQLRKHGVDAQLDSSHGFDHGVWVPLRRMLPAAHVPVVTVSIQPLRDAAHHFNIGRALRTFRAEGALVLGSGGFVHNLGALDWQASHGEREAWAETFSTWMLSRLRANDREALLDWMRQAPNARHAHPTPEHLLPLFVALGALHDDERLVPIHVDTELGHLAMEALISSAAVATA